MDDISTDLPVELSEDLVGRIGDFLENNLLEDTPTEWVRVLNDCGGFKWADLDVLSYNIIITDQIKFTTLLLSV